jgi:uncharacterized membrane protein
MARKVLPAMTFTFPIALFLLLLLPVAAYIGYPRLSYRRTRDLTSLVLRLLILSLLILAISGAQVVRSADQLAVVFLVDASDSIDPDTRDAQVGYVRDALAEMGNNDSAGIVLFGANAVVERQVSALTELGDVRSAPATSNTDLAEAIRLGLALFPTDAARRMVVLSDGRPTVGDTEAAAGLAAAANVQIDYVLFNPQRAPEVQVTDVDVPSTVSAGQQFDLSLSVDAEADTPAQITVLDSGTVIYQETVNLEAGENRYGLSLEAGESGFKDFQVIVSPEGEDGYTQNNQLSAFSRVVGPPRVLVMATDANEIVHVVRALEEAGLQVDVRAPSELPIGIAALADYDSIVMANIAARNLSPARMAAVDAYVSDLGGGLVFIGGPESYGPGGYFETPIEDALPVETRIRDQQRLPQLTVAYIIDTSGSMAAVGPSGVQNIELAKEAIIRSINFLQPTDNAGVANFDTNGSWIARVQPVLDRRALQSLVATLRPGGGTDILAGMNLVAGELLQNPATRKHIILLTDGGASPQGLLELTGDINAQADVTTSVIAIGAGAAGFLDDMAEIGGGNFYLIDNVSQIPTIFTQETVLATRSYIFEEQFFPSGGGNSPILNGITSVPPLQGYVATTPKQTASVVMRGGEFNDPILAQWQYGLGRSVAFTSDATARWGAAWVDWDNFSRFWSQAVQWTITETAESNIESRVVMDGEEARIVVDARDADGTFLNGLGLEMSLVDPNLESQRVTLQQVAPGRYEAPFTPGDEGAYILRIAGSGGDVAVNQTSGWVMSYSPEYDLRVRPAEAGVLGAVAALTDGRELEIDGNVATIFERTQRGNVAQTPISAQLVLLALLLLPLDIAIRRLIITRWDWARLWAWVTGATGTATEATQERMASLLTARDRAREGLAGAGGAPTPGRTISDLRSRRGEGGTTGAAPSEVPQPTTTSAGQMGFGNIKARQSGAKPPEKAEGEQKESRRVGGGNNANTGSSSMSSKLLQRRREQHGDDE